ncbi:MAG: rod shape-determining protein MreC [Alphaproteobacteria bacterium]|nr:rod shape-determining protein MreC [Alphaproteobacteria bacterium]
MIRPSVQVRATLQRTTPPLLILLSVAIIILGKADQTMFESLRTAVADRAAPLLDILSRPLSAASSAVDHARGLVEIYQDNQRLTEENTRLLQWQQIALKLSSDNQQLRGLLKAIPESAVSYETARVIANSGGRYVRTVMINAGTDQGLARGQAAVASEGLIGRLTEVGSRAARVLLITDLNSRIPVVVERTHANAVLAGDNSERPRLLYLSDSAALQVGDRIVTSGEGGVFPPGLAVGVVASLANGIPQVEPFVELSQLGYVVVVDYGLSAALPPPASPMATRASAKAKGSDSSAVVR